MEALVRPVGSGAVRARHRSVSERADRSGGRPSLALKVLAILLQSNSFAAADPTVFQSLFGMMFTVIIALEFRRTLLVITERQQSIVHVRAVVLIAMLAIVRKLIIFDLAGGAAVELFALAAAILALGGVYWLVRDRETRDAASPN
jgi:uncharacterized membrane protein (DUF373 family)